jgi:vitamin B12 transporter
MKPLPMAGLLGLAAWGAHAQIPAPAPHPALSSTVVVTATRSLQPGSTLRDTVVLTRDDLEAAGALSLGELLERRAGVQLRATGGPGQPQGLFIRGTGTAHALVLVDGLRVSSATVGTTSIEHIPLELVERVEVVKGPLSSLYGSEAIGGVVQVFTRGKPVPHLFGSLQYGTDNDRRAAAGLTAADGDTAISLALGGRKVDAPSATNERVAFCHDPDRDPYDNGFANLRASQRLWQGETVAVEAFASRGRARFDGCGPDDRNDQTLAGARLTSSTNFARWWASRLSIGQGVDRLQIRGAFPARFETRQNQATWINELTIPAGTMLVGLETVRQRLASDENAGRFERTRRDTNSAFLGLDESWQGRYLEASARYDDDDAFGRRTTGSVSYGIDWPGIGIIAATAGRAFRAPTFFDLYGPVSEFYRPNPALRPERSRSVEASVRSLPAAAWQWRITAFENRIEDLIVFVGPGVENVNRGRIRGVEASLERRQWGLSWRASATIQEPRDEATGHRLRGRSDAFGSLEASRSFGSWHGAVAIFAASERHDSHDESAATRLPGYAVVDARLRYRFSARWSAEAAITNVADRRYETTVGFPAPRRAAFLGVRLEAF